MPCFVFVAVDSTENYMLSLVGESGNFAVSESAVAVSNSDTVKAAGRPRSSRRPGELRLLFVYYCARHLPFNVHFELWSWKVGDHILNSFIYIFINYQSHAKCTAYQKRSEARVLAYAVPNKNCIRQL